METEQQNGKGVVAAKRLWKIVRIVLYMCKTGLMSKTKLMLDLNLMLKRGHRAITTNRSNRRRADVIASLTACRGSADVDVISSAHLVLREYEFSCSNTPAAAAAPLSRRKRYRGGYDDAAAASAAVQRVFELLGDDNDNNSYDEAMAAVARESPVVVRVTDSPFPVKEDGGGDGDVVDKAAEEFIKRFYKNLKLQKKMESPYNCGWDR